MSAYTALIRRFGNRRWFAALGRRLTPVDRWLARHTKGRWTVAGRAPSLLITTTGRRSGQPRTQPLLYVRHDDAYVVVGSNWGRPDHPAWSGNLLADPAATVTVDGVAVRVDAHLAEGAERDRLWALLTRMWPAYAAYEERAGDRRIRLFRLVPRD